MPLRVNREYKNLPVGLDLPDTDLVVLSGSNNSGKSAILQYINIFSELKDKADYISPRRFDLSNEVAIALNTDQELLNMWNERKSQNNTIAELSAPDPIRELISLPNTARAKILEWHNRYFGTLKVERSRPDNEFSPARVTIDDRLATQQGSGSRAVLSVLCSLLHPDRPIILIDEPEIGIEPQVQKKLAELIRRVVAGSDNLPKKRVYLATHSHLFLDKENLKNNWIVSKGPDGKARMAQVTTPEELHGLIYRLLGNSPDDLFFPDNLLIVEGPSDQIFWRRVLALNRAGGIAVHFAEGETNIAAALPAIEQMLRTLAYLPWYREKICIAVDESVPDTRVNEWREFLHDDGTRVRRITKNGIEFFYPISIMKEVTGLEQNNLVEKIKTFIDTIRHGATEAQLGNFRGSKRQLAIEVERQMTEHHLDEIADEIQQIVHTVKAGRFSVANVA